MTPAERVLEVPRPRSLEPEDAWSTRFTKAERTEVVELARKHGVLVALMHVDRLARRMGVVTFGVKQRAAETLTERGDGVRALAYVDRGDPYDPTVVYDDRSGLFRWGASWGDLVVSDVKRVKHGRSPRRRNRR